MERDAGTGEKSYSGAAAVGGVIRVSLISLELGRFGGVQVIIEKKKREKGKVMESGQIRVRVPPS